LALLIKTDPFVTHPYCMLKTKRVAYHTILHIQ